MKNLSKIIFLITLLYMSASPGIESSHDPRPSAALVAVKPRLGDRYYMKSVLSHVFGPASNLIIRENIFYNGAVFGGPCDEYEQIRTGGDSAKELVDPESFCPSDKIGSRLTQIPEENVIRIGYLAKTCGALVSDSESLSHAVKKVGNIQNNPSLKDYIGVLKLFNATATVTEKEEAVFLKIEGNSAYQKLSGEQRWKLLLKMACSSVDWQIL